MKTKTRIFTVLFFLLLGSAFKVQSKQDLQTMETFIYDDDFYQHVYPDGGLGLAHFLAIGVNEWRMPSLIFDPVYYRENNPDLNKAFGDNARSSYYHFLAHGMAEMRQGSKFFDPKFYKSEYKDLRNAFGDDNKKYYVHYLQFGYKEKRKAVNDSPVSE